MIACNSVYMIQVEMGHTVFVLHKYESDRQFSNAIIWNVKEMFSQQVIHVYN